MEQEEKKEYANMIMSLEQLDWLQWVKRHIASILINALQGFNRASIYVVKKKKK